MKRHKRIVVTRYGGPEELRLVEEECPEPKDGEVRVRVLAAGVSLPDVLAREGVHPETPQVPFTPGWDLVGVVDRVGAGVSGIAPGQIGTWVWPGDGCHALCAVAARAHPSASNTVRAKTTRCLCLILRGAD